MSVFNVFFDTPATRPFQSYRSQLELKRVRVASQGQRATISIGDVTIGPFVGELRLTVYRGASLVHVETVVHTQEDRRAILYDTGLALPSASKSRFAWIDTEGKLQRQEASSDAADHHLAVRHRTLIAETASGSVACFPPPHQFFFPRDLTDNLEDGLVRPRPSRAGRAVRLRHSPGRARGRFVRPLVQRPARHRPAPGRLLSPLERERGASACARSCATRTAIAFPSCPAITRLPATGTWRPRWRRSQEKAKGGPRTIPDSAQMFKDMGVEIVHLAEFHGDGHPQDAGPLRLPEMEAMFAECKRLSDGELLVLPGEEANIGLGTARAGKEAGHWLYLFPKPVYWTMKRAPGQPFVEDQPPFGRVYHVGNGDDMVHLLEREGGLAWTSHARIKGSSWTPDLFRNQPFYKSSLWLGAAWKAMPADLSLDRLGTRGLNLLDDMANWGQKKYLPGEVDVFKIDHTHELYRPHEHQLHSSRARPGAPVR